MRESLDRRTFLGVAATMATGTVGAVGEVAGASVPPMVYTTKTACLRDSPYGTPLDTLDTYTGGYVLDSSGSWTKLSFNEDGESSSVTSCMAETDGTATGWVMDAGLTTADFAYPVSGTVSREWQRDYHEELDISTYFGESVYAAADGSVTTADVIDDSSDGKRVLLDHGNGWATHYYHLDTVSVDPGESITRGTEVGTAGTSGDATETHVAFRILKDGVSQPVPGVSGHDLLAMAGVPRDY
jgi:murein DD-endopeptidase MepM/ murein hydrolase activator NlpD